MARSRQNDSIRLIALMLFAGLVLALCLGSAEASPASASRELRTSQSGQITGTVTAADSHLPIINVLVQVYYESGSLVYQQGSTDANGVYTITGLASGNYKLHFRFFSGEQTLYAPEWYENQPDEEHVNLVSVTNGQTTSGIDATMDVGGKISGIVTALDGGAPLATAYVEAYGESDTICLPGSFCSPRVFTYTNSNGEYTLTGFETGNYRVSFWAHDYLSLIFNNQTDWENANLVHVILGQTTNSINGALTFGGSITGHVIDVDSGMPVEGAYVFAFNSPTAAEICYDCPSYVSADQTDATGAYSLGGLPTGSYYAKFQKSGYVKSYYDGHSRLLDGDPISVTAAQITPNIDAALSLGGQISGQVTSTQDNSPLEWVDVYVYNSPDMPIDNYLYTGRTNTNGSYIVNELPAGEYYLRFVKYGYRDVYYNNQTSLSQADTVDVILGQITEDINVSMDQMGVITGRVTDSVSGDPIAGVEVAVYNLSYNNLNPKYYRMTDEDGIYTISGLDPGNYYLQFSNSGYLPIFYDQKQSLLEADSVSAGFNSITNHIDAILSPGGTISGNVIDAPIGDSQQNVVVCLYTNRSADTCEVFGSAVAGHGAIKIAITDASGDYSFASLPSDVYYVEFIPEGQAPIFYRHGVSLPSANPIIVVAGDLTEHIDLVLNPKLVYFPLISR